MKTLQPPSLSRLRSSPRNSPGAPSFYRPCWVDVHLDALRHNVRLIQSRLASSVKILAVVKANGYGHGLVPVARAALASGAAYLGVSSLEEGVAMRAAKITAPVLVMGSLYPFENFPVLFDKKLIPTVASLDVARALDAVARQRHERLSVHAKIDSGFGRIGVMASYALPFIEQLSRCRGLHLQGLYTHFTSSDTDPHYTRQQMNAFLSVVEQAAHLGIRPPLVHMANSAALLRYPETHGAMVRPGLAIYGVAPYEGAAENADLRPVLEWKSRIIFLKSVPSGFTVSYGKTWTSRRPSRIATLAAGYADGYPRLLSNQGFVLLHGQRAPVTGRVTMDMMMADVTDLPDCRIGDEAVLIGRQGSERITAEQIARQAQTNAYEILCRIADRMPRVYHHGDN